MQTPQMENYPLLAFDFNGCLAFVSFVNSPYFKFDVVLINITFLRYYQFEMLLLKFVFNN